MVSSRGPAGGQPRASPRIRGSPVPPTSNRWPEPPLGSRGRPPPRMNRHAPPQARRHAEKLGRIVGSPQRRKSLVAVAQRDGEAFAVAPLLEALRSPLRLGQELELALPLGPLREVRDVEACPILDALVTSRCRHTHRSLERRKRTPGLARPVSARAYSYSDSARSCGDHGGSPPLARASSRFDARSRPARRPEQELHGVTPVGRLPARPRARRRRMVRSPIAASAWLVIPRGRGRA